MILSVSNLFDLHFRLHGGGDWNESKGDHGFAIRTPQNHLPEEEESLLSLFSLRIQATLKQKSELLAEQLS